MCLRGSPPASQIKGLRFFLRGTLTSMDSMERVDLPEEVDDAEEDREERMDRGMMEWQGCSRKCKIHLLGPFPLGEKKKASHDGIREEEKRDQDREDSSQCCSGVPLMMTQAPEEDEVLALCQGSRLKARTELALSEVPSPDSTSADISSPSEESGLLSSESA